MTPIDLDLGNSGHSVLGASSYHRWGPCPGSVRLCKTVPKRDSEYAKLGSHAHSVAEKWLRTGVKPRGEDPELLAAVEVYVEYVKELKAKVCVDRNSLFFLEHGFKLTDLHPDLWGTADCVMYDGATQTLYVIDYKHGAGKFVSPVRNEQLMYYGLGAYLTLRRPVKKVILVIVQPRFDGDELIKQWATTPQDLIDFGGQLVQDAVATSEIDAPFKTGDHCQFCDAKMVCPAMKKEAELSAQQEFALVNLPEFSPVVIGDLLRRADLVETWVKGVREFAYSEAQQGRTPEGFKLVAKKARRQWNNAEEAQKFLASRLNNNTMRECLTSPELKSPAQVEKVVGKGGKDLVNEVCSAVSSGTTLVTSDDPRPEVAPGTTALDDFSNL